MQHDFDLPIPRRHSNCVKWDSPEAANALPMWVADMDFRVAQPIIDALHRRVEHGVFGYTIVPDEYYEAVISWFARRHQWHIEREWMLYTSGVVPALSATIKALAAPGEKVLIQTPVYNCFFSSIRNNGCEVLENKLVRKNYSFEIDWNDFEIKCADEKTTVFLLCNPHNPTGRVWTRKELERMRDICHLHHVRIVSDEIHCELIMPGYHFCPMGIIDSEAIILNSPSKSFNIAGLQIANIICQDAEIRRRIDRAININEVCDVNPFAPIAVKAAYNESEEWIDELNQYLCQNYQILNLFFSKELPQCKVCKLEGTYLVWIDVSALGIPVEQLCERLLNKGKVWVNPGTMYGTESGMGYIRINIACPRNRLIEGLKRIKATI